MAPRPRKPVVPGGAKTFNPNINFKSLAQKEAERQALAYENAARRSSNYGSGLTPNDPGYSTNLGVAPPRNDPEAQRRYDSSNNNGNTDFYKEAAKGLLKGSSPSPVDLSGLAGFAKPQSSGGGYSGGSGGGGSSGSSGGGGAPVAPQMTLEEQLAAINQLQGTIDPSLKALVPTTGELELMYKRLTDQFNAQEAQLNKDYQSAIGAVSGNYGASNNLIQQAISGDQNTLAQAASTFGITPEQWQSGTTAQGQTEALNRLIGQNTANQAVDLAWFEKMQGLDTNQFNNFENLAIFAKQGAMQDASQRMQDLQEMANEQARQQALASLMMELEASGGGSSGGGGGGGGRRGGGYSRRGGSGGSGDLFYETIGAKASEDWDQDLLGLAQMIEGLPGHAKNEMLAALNRSGWDIEGARKQFQSYIDNFNNASPMDILQGKGGGLQAIAQAPFYQGLMNLLDPWTRGLGAIGSASVSDTSTQSNKNYGVDPLTPYPTTSSFNDGNPYRPAGSQGKLSGALGKAKTPKPAPKPKPPSSSKPKPKAPKGNIKKFAF